MKYYCLVLLLLNALLYGGEDLFLGVDPISGTLLCSTQNLTAVSEEGKVVSLVNSNDSSPACTFVYHANSTDIVDCEQRRYQYTHDGAHLLSKKVWNADGSFFSFETWESDQVIAHSHYNEAGELIYQSKIEQVDDTFLATTWDRGNTTWVKTEYENNRLVHKSESCGNSVHYVYNPENLLAAEITQSPAASHRQFYFYSGEGHLQEVIIDDGFTGDPTDLSSVTNRKRVQVHPSIKKPELIILYRWNSELGVEIIEKRIEGLYNDQANLVFEEFFDIHSKSLIETYFEYDGLGHLSTIHDGCGNGIESIYDSNHQLLRETQLDKNQPSKSIIYHYNEAAQPDLLEKFDLKGEATAYSYTYNSLGQITASIDQLGNRTHFEYNPLGQLATVIHPAVCNANGTIIHPTQRWIYDGLGRLVAYIDANGEKRSADSLSQNEDVPFNPWTPQPFPLAYPKNLENSIVEPFVSEAGSYGLRITVRNESDEQATYTCDALNRIIEIQLCIYDEVLKHEKMSYDPTGRPEVLSWRTGNEWISTQWIYGLNGRVEQVIEGVGTTQQAITTYAYDTQDRLISITKPDGVTILFTYEQNALSHISSSDGTVNHPFQAEETIVKHYDHQNRCIGFVLPDQTAVSYEWKGDEIAHLFRLDSFGNILYDLSSEDFTLQEASPFSKPRTPAKKTNSSHQLTQCGKRKYTYDLNGNITSIKTKNESIDCHYDALNRLIRVEDGEYVYQYVYDGQSRRIERLIFENEAVISHEYFLYDGFKEIGLIKDGQLVQFRLLDPNIQSEIGATVAIELDSTVYRPIHDDELNIRQLASLEGKIGVTYQYDSWRERTQIDSGIECPWRYRGKRTDDETGFVNFGRRYYMPFEGQWLTPDPLGYPEGGNRYAYCQGKPDQTQDHFGLFVSDAQTESQSTAFSIYDWVQQHISFEKMVVNDVDTIAHQLFNNGWLAMLGYYNEESKVGIVGNGELNDKVRVTIINGMLNMLEWAEENAMIVSKTHGDINVHYVYRPTRGWTHDLIKATLGKFGYSSYEAQLLSQTWKELIQEMGGPEGGGTIVHYAHSIGAADTYAARHFLTPEEQRMIRVISLGSPIIIPHEGFGSVINYMSIHDGIRYFILFAQKQNVVYLDSYWGIPIADHLLNSGTYKTLMETLGKAFIHEYVKG